MPHFGSQAWPDEFGRIASLTSASTVLMEEATGSGSTEGTNQLAFTTREAGMYRVSVYMKVTEVSDAATSHVALARVAYNDGSAIAAKAISVDPAVTATLDCTTLNDNQSQSMVIYSANAQAITITVLNTVVGAKTAGAGEYRLVFAIEKVSA